MILTKRKKLPTTQVSGAPGPKFSIADVIAGVSVSFVIIPQSLAYAELAGLPSYVGLFASAIPLLVFAVFASSPFLQTGPVALTSLLTFAALTSAEFIPETDEYVAAAAVLALLVGAFRFAMGTARLGWLAYLISRPVLVGFTNAAAIIILSSQLPKALGTDEVVPDGSSLSGALWSLSHPGDWSPQAIALAGITLFFMLAGRNVHKLFPGVLAAAATGLIISNQTNYPSSVIGKPNPLPEGLPEFTLNLEWDMVPALAVSAFVVALVGFAEPSAIARVFAKEENQSWSVNRELIASGLANTSAAFTGAFPVGGSFSRSSLNKLAGATSRWSGAITGLTVLAFLPFTSLLNPLPQAILGGVVVGAAIKLIKPMDLVKLWRISKPQGVLSIVTFVATLLVAPSIHWALIAAVVLTFVVHQLEKPKLTLPTDAAGLTGSTYHLSGFCWLGSEKRVKRLISDAVRESNSDTVTIDVSGVTDFDSELERSIQKALVNSGRTVSFSH